MTKEELKSMVFEPKQTWWFIENMRIRRVEYLCVFPFNNPDNLGSYDIIIYKDLDEPKRIYRKELIELIETHKHINSYEDAKIELIKRAEENLESIKKIYAPMTKEEQ
jgi:hypothetical protein